MSTQYDTNVRLQTCSRYSFLTFNISLQPLMLIVPDVQDVYTPLETDIIVQVSKVTFGIFTFIF